MQLLGWGFVFVAAALFIVTLVVGQRGCPIPTCRGPEGDAWMPAFFFAPIGLPALVASVFFISKQICAKFASLIPYRALAEIRASCVHRTSDPVSFHIRLFERTSAHSPSDSGSSISLRNAAMYPGGPLRLHSRKLAGSKAVGGTPALRIAVAA